MFEFSHHGFWVIFWEIDFVLAIWHVVKPGGYIAAAAAAAAAAHSCMQALNLEFSL